MTIKARKFSVHIADTIPPISENIFEYFSKKYKMLYVGVHKREDKMYIYFHFVNRVLQNKLYDHLISIKTKINNISTYKQPLGVILTAHGERKTHGGSLKRKKDIPHEANTTVAPPSPTPPVIQEYVPVNPIVLPKNLPGIPEISDMSRDFHAIWGSQNGHWFPIGYVGPERYIVSGKRKSIPQVQIDELFKEQKDSCNECSCDVFMGKLSNADVDHIIPLRLGGSCQMSNLQILCVTCHRRKTALECKKIRCNVIVGHRINLEPGVTYVACSDIDDPDYEVLSKNPKDALSNRDGLFKLVY